MLVIAEMRKTLNILGRIAGDLVLAAAVALGVLLVGVRLVGLKPFTVLSGSMEPTYHTGSLIYVKSVKDSRSLADGTVITFMIDENTAVTHRIVGAVPDENEPGTIRYRTKGDANDYEDGTLVHYKNIVGVPVFTVPLLGYFSNYIQQPPGCYVAVSAGALLLLLMFLPELLSAIFSEEEEELRPMKKKKAAKARTKKTSRREKANTRYAEPEPEYWDEEEYEEEQVYETAPVYEDAAREYYPPQYETAQEEYRPRHAAPKYAPEEPCGDIRAYERGESPRRRGGAHLAPENRGS